MTAAIAAAIVDWFGSNGRDLAFRRTNDPYAVLVSEAMAQQTQAERAAAYWQRFMVRFPTVDVLADATPADVLREWQGLGYNERAVRLWRAARMIRDAFDSRVPPTLDALEQLPGVGPYTARAIAAIAFGQPVGAVDVNVMRVLGRILGGADGLPRPAIQVAAEAAAATTDPAAWTHAVMDLGATICHPKLPRCDDCPAGVWCRYAAAGSRPIPAQATTPTTPFPATNRWLRGRILDRLRDASGDAWVALDEPIGDHPLDRVHAAAEALASEGMVELARRTPATVDARLAIA
jgi:A/G-specific adenine glycosylase